MTAPTPYELPDGHMVIETSPHVSPPDGWEWAEPFVAVVRPVPPPDPEWLVVEGFPDGRYVKVPAKWQTVRGGVGVTTVGEMRGRTDLNQWEYANPLHGNWSPIGKSKTATNLPDDLPLVVRRKQEVS